MPAWILTTTCTYNLKSLWEEQASPNDESKCDKITVHLSRKDSKHVHNKNIVAVIIYVMQYWENTNTR
jgi:pyridoxine 5'-phosphate synthase PdxJ